MTYICHDTVKTTEKINAVIDVKGWMSRIADWMKSTRDGQRLDPRNEHLMRDVGVSPGDAPGIFKSAPVTNQLPYSKIGANIRFIDLFLSEHMDRGPR